MTTFDEKLTREIDTMKKSIKNLKTACTSIPDTLKSTEVQSIKEYFEEVVRPFLPFPPEDYLSPTIDWKSTKDGGYWYPRLYYQFPFIRPLIGVVAKAFEEAENCNINIAANEAETQWPSIFLGFCDSKGRPTFSIYFDLNVWKEGSTCRKVKVGEQTVVQDIYVFECDQE